MTDTFADPGLFGRNARVGFGRGVGAAPSGPIDPPDPPDRHEKAAPYCDGPGHLYGHASPGYYCWAGPDSPYFQGYVNPPEPLVGVVEPCPCCPGEIRRHDRSRHTSAVTR